MRLTNRGSARFPFVLCKPDRLACSAIAEHGKIGCMVKAIRADRDWVFAIITYPLSFWYHVIRAEFLREKKDSGDLTFFEIKDKCSQVPQMSGHGSQVGGYHQTDPGTYPLDPATDRRRNVWLSQASDGNLRASFTRKTLIYKTWNFVCERIGRFKYE